MAWDRYMTAFLRRLMREVAAAVTEQGLFLGYYGAEAEFLLESETVYIDMLDRREAARMCEEMFSDVVGTRACDPHGELFLFELRAARHRDEEPILSLGLDLFVGGTSEGAVYSDFVVPAEVLVLHRIRPESVYDVPLDDLVEQIASWIRTPLGG